MVQSVESPVGYNATKLKEEKAKVIIRCHGKLHFHNSSLVSLKCWLCLTFSQDLVGPYAFMQNIAH